MHRFVWSDEQWERIAPLLPGKVGDPGRSGGDNRLFMEAVLRITRVGAPWRDLPPMFGNWSSVLQRFRRWAVKGVFERLFQALSGDQDRRPRRGAGQPPASCCCRANATTASVSRRCSTVSPSAC